MSKWSGVLVVALVIYSFSASGALGVQADLVIDQMSHSPDSPAAGSAVLFTVTVKNQGSASTLLPFAVSFWSNLSSEPTAATTPQQTQAATSLAAGSSVQLTFPAIAPAAGTYTAWAFADQAGLIAESDKTNNAGPAPAGHAWTVVPVTITPPPNPNPTSNPTPNPIGTPPAITSALNVNGAVGAPFSYTITASGSAPIVYSAANLPPGLSFSVDTISGTPAANGAFTISLSATNSAGADNKTLSLAVAAAAGAPQQNAAPRLLSLPAVTPNPAAAGQAVQFSAAASDTDGDALAYTWDFGDGTLGTGPSVSHTYAAAGLYNVALNVSDGVASANASISVGVNAQMAAQAGSTHPLSFAVKKAMLKFNLKATLKDSLTLSGVLPVQNFSPGNKTVQVEIGNLSREFQLDAHGRGGDSANSLRLTGKLKSGAFTDASVKFMITMKKQTLSKSFNNFAFPGMKNNSILNIPVVISTTGNDWQVDFVKFNYNPLTGSTTQITAR